MVSSRFMTFRCVLNLNAFLNMSRILCVLKCQMLLRHAKEQGYLSEWSPEIVSIQRFALNILQLYIDVSFSTRLHYLISFLFGTLSMDCKSGVYVYCVCWGWSVYMTGFVSRQSHQAARMFLKQQNFLFTFKDITTAKAIAQSCGILSNGIAMEGPEFRNLSIEELDRILPRLQVLCATVIPHEYTMQEIRRENSVSSS